MVTIESSRDARDIQSGLKKMRICTNPEVLAPQPKEHAINPDATEPIPVTVPGDSKAEISIAPSTFSSDVKLTVVAKSIDTKRLPSSNKKKPSGAVLTMKREPADAKAEKPMSVALSVSKAAATEFQAILSSMNTARRRLLSFVYNEGDEIALIQHYYDSGTSGGEWVAMPNSRYDPVSATVKGDVPPEVLNSPSFTGEITVSLICF
jgi:hypothetical protein